MAEQIGDFGTCARLQDPHKTQYGEPRLALSSAKCEMTAHSVYVFVFAEARVFACAFHWLKHLFFPLSVPTAQAS
jgi:hypothetical protein